MQTNLVENKEIFLKESLDHKQEVEGFHQRSKIPYLLSHVVMIRKKNKYKIYSDLMELTEAYSKDCFPLPWIDQVVHSIVVDEFFSFMVAFSIYKIPMYPLNMEKISLVTNHGLYCFRFVPFELKNDKAIEVCPLNWTMIGHLLKVGHEMFWKQLVKMGVKDMLVKGEME